MSPELSDVFLWAYQAFWSSDIVKSFDPKGKGRFGQTFREEEKKKEKRAQDLWLIPGRPSSGREKGEKKRYGDIGIEKAELLPGLPKLGMEPPPFGGIEMDFGIGEKVLVILGGLPVPDHKSAPPCS